ncbi:hypothetical protein JHK85_000609 [Glycine max]|nr:hypothetical protein JHK85_000609 [Glycine max]KAG5087981.1 hypothetical protein JHK86_000593 [Glycine max]
MAHIVDKIKTIDGSKETLKLAIRITELWFVGTPGRSEQAEMVIVDSDDGDLNLNASPKALDKLLSHLLAFKVKIQPQYKNFAVLECFTNLTLIIDVLDMLPDAEPFNECDDEARSSQISPAQLSPNKLSKHEKIE